MSAVPVGLFETIVNVHWNTAPEEFVVVGGGFRDDGMSLQWIYLRDGEIVLGPAINPFPGTVGSNSAFVPTSVQCNRIVTRPPLVYKNFSYLDGDDKGTLQCWAPTYTGDFGPHTIPNSTIKYFNTEGEEVSGFGARSGKFDLGGSGIAKDGSYYSLPALSSELTHYNIDGSVDWVRDIEEHPDDQTYPSAGPTLETLGNYVVFTMQRLYFITDASHSGNQEQVRETSYVIYDEHGDKVSRTVWGHFYILGGTSGLQEIATPPYTDGDCMVLHRAPRKFSSYPKGVFT